MTAHINMFNKKIKPVIILLSKPRFTVRYLSVLFSYNSETLCRMLDYISAVEKTIS